MEEFIWRWLCAFFLSFSAIAVSPTLRGVLGGAGLLGVSVALAVSLISEPMAKGPGEAMSLTMVALAIGSGVSTGLPFALVLEAIPVAGRLLDTLRGSQQAEALLPQLESRGSALETSQALIAVAWIMASGAYEPAIEQLRECYRDLAGRPVGDAVSTVGYAVSTVGYAVSTVGYAVSLFAQAFLKSVLAVAPAIIVFGCLELFGMLLSRMEPRGGIASELQGLKLVVGLLCAALILTQVAQG